MTWQVRQKFTSGGIRMRRFYQQWNTPSRFGDLMVLGFLLVQCLDGGFTYVGVSIWGLGVEANPLITSAVSTVGLGAGLFTTKLMAVGLGILLHLRRVHNLVAFLTLVYLGVAILPWTALFLAN